MNNEKLTFNGIPLIFDKDAPEQPLLLSNTKDGVKILNTITGEEYKVVEGKIVYVERIENENR